MAQPGRDAYRGFNYQIEVSIWLALESLFSKRLGDFVEVEPLGGEDLEILRRESDEVTSGRVAALSLPAQDPHRYIIQIKSRHAGQWYPSELAKIIRGNDPENSTSRIPPEEELTHDPRAALLFVTDSTVHSDLVWFLVGKADFAVRTTPRPGSATKQTWSVGLYELDDSLLSRVGVLQKRTFDQIGHDIERILAQKLNVPHSSRPACREGLHKRFREAMLGQHPIVTFDELQKLASSPR